MNDSILFNSSSQKKEIGSKGAVELPEFGGVSAVNCKSEADCPLEDRRDAANLLQENSEPQFSSQDLANCL